MTGRGDNWLQRFVERRFADRSALADALAAEVAGRLRAAIAARGHALLALSGGSTPRTFMHALAKQPLEWSQVIVTLCDERWVPSSDARSNARLVAETLLQGHAAAARFVPLFADAPDPESGLAQVTERIAALPLPLDVAVLGLGLDGHTASLFADGDRIADALDPHVQAPVLPMRAASAGEPRITLTGPVLAAARALYLHIEGAEKIKVFERLVHNQDAPMRSPLHTLMQYAGAPLAVYRCD